MRLPNHVFETVKRVAAKYPGRRSHDDYALALNEIAWVHRLEGFGLSEKTSGTRVHHPILGDIAEDILQLPDGTHWDVFSSAGENLPMVPNQGESIVPNTRRKRLDPVDPGFTGEIPDKDPPPDQVIPPPVQVCACRAEEVLKAIEGTNAHIKGLSDAVHKLFEAQTGIHLAEIKEMISKIPSGSTVKCKFPW